MICDALYLIYLGPRPSTRIDGVELDAAGAGEHRF